MRRYKLSTVKYPLATLLAALLLAACSSNNDEGNVSSDYLRATDVVLNGSHTSTTLHIEADCTWRIVEEAEWLAANPVQGEGSMDVELTTGVNPSSIDERSCQIKVVSEGGVERVVTVSQTRNNEQMTVSTETLSFGEAGGELEFSITSNTRWTITGGADWLTLSETTGLDNGSVTVTVQPTNVEMDRNTVLTITGNSGTAVLLTITQRSKNVTLTIEPALIEAPAKGGTSRFNVMSNTDWTVTSDVTTWVTINQRSGSNEGEVTVTLTDNVVSEPRTANIRVVSASGRQERTCVITQAAATVPSLAQPAISGIGRYEATLYSTFTSSLDVTECGFCYATHDNPTVSDRNVPVTGQQGMNGDLQTTLSGLNSGTLYYIRAWARNANGIGYSATATLTTEGTIPGEEENPTPNL